MTDEDMITALRTKGYLVKAPIDQKTCPHHNKRGTGMISANGASRTDWYCPDCGASYHHETPGDPNYGQKPVWNY